MNMNILKNIGNNDNSIKIMTFKIATDSSLSISFDKENVLYFISKNGVNEDKNIVEKTLILSSDNYTESDTLALYVYSDIRSIKLEGSIYECTFEKNDLIKEINVSGLEFKNCPVLKHIDDLQTIVLYDSTIENNITWFNSFINELPNSKNYRCIVVNDDAACIASESNIIEKNWFFGSKLRYTQIYGITAKQFYTPTNAPTPITERVCYYNNSEDLETWVDNDGNQFKGYGIEKTVDLKGAKDCNSSIYCSLATQLFETYDSSTNINMNETDGFYGNKIELRLYDSQDNLIDVDGNIVSDNDSFIEMDKFIAEKDGNPCLWENMVIYYPEPVIHRVDSKFTYKYNMISYFQTKLHFPKNVSYIKSKFYIAATDKEYEFVVNENGYWTDYENEKVYLGDKPLSIDAYNSSGRNVKLDYNNSIISNLSASYTGAITITEYKTHLIDIEPKKGNGLDKVVIKINPPEANPNHPDYDSTKDYSNLITPLYINPERSFSINECISAKVGIGGNVIFLGDSLDYRIDVNSTDRYILSNVTIGDGPLITKSGEDFTSTSIYGSFIKNDNGNILRIKASYGFKDMNGNRIERSDYIYVYVGNVYSLINDNYIEITKAKRYYKQDNKISYRCPYDIVIDNQLMDDSIIASGIDRLWVSADYGNGRTAMVLDQHFDRYTKIFDSIDESPLKNNDYNYYFSPKCVGKVLDFIDDGKFKFIWSPNNTETVHLSPNEKHGSMCTYSINGNGNSGIYGTAPKASVIGANYANISYVGWVNDLGLKRYIGVHEAVYETIFCDRLKSSQTNSDNLHNDDMLYFDDDISMDFNYAKNINGRFLKLGESYYLDKNKQTIQDYNSGSYSDTGKIYIRDYINILEHMDMIYILNNGKYVKYDGSFLDMNPTATYYIRFYNIPNVGTRTKSVIATNSDGSYKYEYMKFKICGSSESDQYALHIYDYTNNKYSKVTSDKMIYKWVSGTSYSTNSRVFVSDGTKYGGYIYKCTSSDNNTSNPLSGNGWKCEKYVLVELYYLYCPNSSSKNLNLLNSKYSYEERYDCIPPIDAASYSFGPTYIRANYFDTNTIRRYYKRMYDCGIPFIEASGNDSYSFVDIGNNKPYQYSLNIGAAIPIKANSESYSRSINKVKLSDVRLEDFSTTPTSFVMYDRIVSYGESKLDNNTLFETNYTNPYKSLSGGTSYATPRFAGAVLIFKNILRKKLGYEPSTDEVLNAMADNTISIGNDFVDGRGVLCVGSQNKNNGYTVF